ncbi:winged helix-turn-helix transcriptional regulator [Actinorhabdospora filicis]|nr:helix-turn-helix domain-containing protein [Actinorhabdospora filicis]
MSFADMHCSLARSLEVMGDWWTPLIVRDVYLGVDRFQDLADDLGISRNLLTARLTALVDNGILTRVPYSERPPRHRYALTEAGEELVSVLIALTAWGDRWRAPAEGPPIRFEHHGHEVRPQVSCGECGEALEPAGITPKPGPGGRAAPGTMVVARRLAERAGHRPH